MLRLLLPLLLRLRRLLMRKRCSRLSELLKRPLLLRRLPQRLNRAFLNQ
jgi:hypothetical protein